jgi:sugar phosphate permease
MKRRLMAFAFLSTMLMAVAIFQSNILVSASDPNSWCVCDHWYNKQYLGTPWDLWTASAVTGSPGGGTYYTYHAYWQGGLGANSGG